jgi:hypothetical protein
MGETPSKPQTPRVEQRRSSRFPVVVPMEVRWEELGKGTITESAHAMNVNAQGGLLTMKSHPGIGATVELTNLLSSEKAQGRVVALRRTEQGETRGIAVELIVPSESFWGLNFQLKKTSAQLVKLEQALKNGEVDSRILSEFRDAVDYVRKTAWAVQEWQERRLRHHDPQTLLPLLTVERIRRTTQLSKAIVTDLETREVTRESVGVEELYRAIQRINERLQNLFEDRETPR